MWKTVDDETGDALSYVKIFKYNDYYYGKVKKLLKEPEDKICDACVGKKKGKKNCRYDCYYKNENQRERTCWRKNNGPRKRKVLLLYNS